MKRDQIMRMRAVVTAPLTVGGAATGLNLCDMYLNLQDRNEVLSILQARYPGSLGSVPIGDPDQWFERVASLTTTRTYVSGYAGEMGELKAIETLQSLGIDAHQFGSKIHPANDLVDAEGLEYSVKSYEPENIYQFLGLVRETPESTRYVVNEELFERLEEGGLVERLASEGIEIIDGGWSHLEATSQAAEVLQRIEAGGDQILDSLADDLPAVAAVVALGSIGIDAYRFLHGAVSRKELGVQVVTALTRIGAGAGGGAAGTALGAAIGSAVFPLLGTIIGSTVGGLLGAAGAGAAVRATADYVKWGKSIDAFERLGNAYSGGLPPECLASVRERIYREPRLHSLREQEAAIAERFTAELDPEHPSAPSLAAVLWDTSQQRIGATLANLTRATARLSDSLLASCIDYGIQRWPRQRQSARTAALRMYGSFLVEADTLRLGLGRPHESGLAPVLLELAEKPNHPFKTDVPKEQVLTALALGELADVGSQA